MRVEQYLQPLAALPELQLLVGQGLPEAVVEPDRPLQGTEASLGLLLEIGHQACDRLLAARDDELLAALDLLDELRELGLGLCES
jgi:hypothetical protein